MNRKLYKKNCTIILGLFLLSIVIFCSFGEAGIIIPGGFTPLANKNFVGTVTDFSYTGDIENIGEIPIGSQVHGTYVIGSYTSEPTWYMFGAEVFVQGQSGIYYSWIGISSLNQVDISPNGQNAHLFRAEGYTTDLFGLYFYNYVDSCNGGRVIFDINNFASDNFHGVGKLYYEVAYNSPYPGYNPNASTRTSYTLTFDVTPVPEPGSTLLLLGIGLVPISLSYRRWWKK